MNTIHIVKNSPIKVFLNNFMDIIHIVKNSAIKVYGSVAFWYIEKLCNHENNLNLDHFHHLKDTLYPFTVIPHSPSQHTPHSTKKPLISILVYFPTLEFHIDGIIQYVVFLNRLLLLNIVFSKFIHFVVCIKEYYG